MRTGHDLVDSMLLHTQDLVPPLSKHRSQLARVVQIESTQQPDLTSRFCYRETTQVLEYNNQLQQDILYVRQPHCPIPLIVLLLPCSLHSGLKNLASSTCQPAIIRQGVYHFLTGFLVEIEHLEEIDWICDGGCIETKGFGYDSCRNFHGFGIFAV